MTYEVKALQSKKYSVAIKTNGIAYDMFDIVFHTKSDRTSAFMAISLPEFDKTKGLVSRITFPKTKTYTATISLVPGGKVTSHFVKYTHWLDGNTHFSQDRKVLTTIRNKADRLDTSIGHVFTIVTKGFKGFRVRDESKNKLNDKRMDIAFDMGAVIPPSVKFVGQWYNKSVLHSSNPPQATPWDIYTPLS